jgi:flagellin-like protein
MKKFLKSRKALSPVIAAIILIAVTVAVSIAVAAWMGSLSMGFMETKELTITQMTFSSSGMNVTVTNPGSSDVTVNVVKVNGDTASFQRYDGTDTSDLTFEAGTGGIIEVTYTITAGNKYSVSLFASDGTLVASYSDTAPV